jgi:hypothetical protein
MNTTSLRNRYLATLGISGSVLSGCAASDPGGTTPTADGTAVATAEVTATATVATVDTSAPTATGAEPTAAPTTAPQDVAFWLPTVLPPPPPGTAVTRPDINLPRASCPSGEFCVAEASAVGSTMGAAPFGKCAEKVSDPQKPSSRERYVSFDKEQTQRERTKTKDACCYNWVIPCPGGRPLLIDGVARVASPVSSQAWATEPDRSLSEALSTLPADVREALADHYTTEAAYEHASIAAFARVSLALLAVGAPAELVADTHSAALDEIRHAEAMYRVASACRGERVGPSALSLEGATLQSSIVELAREAFLEGCVGEVAAALVLREEAARASDAATGTLLESLAGDEERHAELAWRTVAWALAQDPVSIDRALAESRAALEHELASELPNEGRALPFVTSARERLVIRKQAIREVVLPCLDALLARHAA